MDYFLPCNTDLMNLKFQLLIFSRPNIFIFSRKAKNSLCVFVPANEKIQRICNKSVGYGNYSFKVRFLIKHFATKSKQRAANRVATQSQMRRCLIERDHPHLELVAVLDCCEAAAAADNKTANSRLHHSHTNVTLKL